MALGILKLRNIIFTLLKCICHACNKYNVTFHQYDNIEEDESGDMCGTNCRE
jgi:hypothetical protein